MRLIEPYPHISINVADMSIFRPAFVQQLPLFRPLVIMTTQKGPVNALTWNQNYVQAANTFGSPTFEVTSDYYSREAALAKQIFRNCGAFIIRVAPADALAGAVVIEASIAEKNVPTYERDAAGVRLVDNFGNLTLTGDEIAGVELVWSYRPLDSDGGETVDNFDSAVKTTVIGEGSGSGEVTWKTYPIMIAYASNPGAWSTNTGFSLFYNPDLNDYDRARRLGTPLFTLVPEERQEDGSIRAIHDIYSSTSNSFALKPNTIDEATMQNMTVDTVLEQAYEGSLPFNLKFFDANYKTIGDIVLAKSVAKIDWDFADGDSELFEAQAISLVDSKKIQLLDDEDLDFVQIGMAIAFSGHIPAGSKVTAVDRVTGVITIDQAITSQIEIDDSIEIGDPSNVQLALDSTVYTDGWVINLLSGVDPLHNSEGNRVHYEQLVISDDENHTLIAELNDSYGAGFVQLFRPERNLNTFLLNGDDGAFLPGATLAQPNGFEIALQGVLAGTLTSSVDGELLILEDPSANPFNYLFDTGYTPKTKKKMLEFMGVRQDVRVSVGALTPATDLTRIGNLNTGQELRNHALLMRESELKGTGCCRASVWPQSGIIPGEDQTQWFPATFWDAYVHGRFQNIDYLNQEPAGLPNSSVDLFSKWSWIPDTEATKMRFWDRGMNYAQKYDMTRVHFPAVRSVYEAETSVLVNNTFVDALVYTKQKLRELWHKWTGVAIPFAELQFGITNDITEALKHMYNNKYTFVPSVYQTADEAKLGYVTHILLRITSPATNRVWDIDIEVYRQNYEG